MKLGPKSNLFCIVMLIALALAGAGCEEKDVPFIVDEDQIASYIRQSAIGRDLFRVDNLIVSGPYQTVLDGATYYDSIVDRTREITVYVVDTTIDYDDLGWLQEAVAVVDDWFELKTLRIAGDDTTEFDHQRLVSRVGFFLKLGDDSQPYVGWLLWGVGAQYPQTTPVSVTVTPEGGTPFQGDFDLFTESPKALRGYRYVKLTDLPEVALGADMALRTTVSNLQSPTRYYQHVSALTETGYMTRPMDRIDRQQYVDTLRLPATNSNLYDVILMQSFNDTTFEFSKAWTFPYKVPQ